MRTLTLFSLCAALSLGCNGKSDGDGETGEDTSGGDTDDTDMQDTADTGDTDDGPDAVCTEPTDIPCTDAIILDLSLHDDKVSEGEVSNTADGADFISFIDGSAGGYDAAARNPWVYVKFTEDGLVRVDIDDETALESMDWDVAVRRYIIRLNGGSSGPSCVGAASFTESTYDDLDSIPDGISYRLDDFYTSDCTIKTDSSGLPGSPSVALGPWWSYAGCVQTTLVPHLVQLADGHIIKLVVEEYYAEDQDVCNSTGSGGSDSGMYTFKWTYMN